MKKTLILIIGLLIIATAIVTYVFVRKSDPKGISEIFDGKSDLMEISAIPLFSTTDISTLGIKADAIGNHGFSSSGRYFFFTALVVNSANSFSKTLLLDLTDGSSTELSGIPMRGIESEPVVPLITTNSDIILYNLETGAEQIAPLDANELVFSSIASPDKRTFVFNTMHGIRLIDTATNTATVLSDKQYDGAYAWTSDNKRILGFKQTDVDLNEAGRSRQLGFWNLAGDFESLAYFTYNNIQSVSWITPDSIARVTTGYDDGSHDYIVNLETKSVVDVGDTSNGLMAGNIVDADQHIFASLGAIPTGTTDNTQIYTRVYEGDQQIHDLKLTKMYTREDLHIISRDLFIYLRKSLDQVNYNQTGTDIVLLNAAAKTEKVLYSVPEGFAGYVNLSVTPDHKNWVLNTNKGFVSGTINQ